MDVLSGAGTPTRLYSRRGIRGYSIYKGHPDCVEERDIASLTSSVVALLCRAGLTIGEAITELGLLIQWKKINYLEVMRPPQIIEAM